MTRTEEQLRVGTERVAARRVRVVKYVVTEEVQVTVPLRREEVRVEELPLEGSPAPLGEEETLVAQGHTTTAGLPDEIVLHAERPVVSVEVVPVERVRLRTEWVQEQRQVRDEVRRERVDVDQDHLGQDRVGQHRVDQDRVDQDRVGQDRVGQERLG
jgi:uncharacterized protein (TIGR02271 family)